MADAQVTYITKAAYPEGHEGITHLGGSNWYWSREAVIQSIEQRTNTFHTLVNGRRADVAVVKGQSAKYLRTHADGVFNDNLLALPSRPT